MDYRDLTKILIKIAGAAIVVFGVIQIPVHFLNYYSLEKDSFLLFVGITVIPVMLTVSIGVILWLLPGIVTNKIVVGPDYPKGKDLEKIQVIAFATIGMYLLVRAIGDIVYWGTILVLLKQEQPGSKFMSLDRYADLTAVVAELLLGLYLVFGSNGLTVLISKIRAR